MPRRNVALNGPDEIDAAIGRRIRTLRVAAGLAQEELAARIGVTFQQLQKYERGDNRASGSRLWRLAGALGVTVSDLFADCGDAAQGPRPESAALFARRDVQEMLRAYVAIADPAVAAALRDLARAAGAPETLAEAAE